MTQVPQPFESRKTLSCTLVIPCYNEAARFREDSFTNFLQAQPDTHLLFVNDGSSDATLPRLQEFASAHAGRVTVLDQQPNGGKGEAVRRGMLLAMETTGSPVVGFWDADLATPLHALPDFLAVLEQCPEVELVFGARVRLLGRHVSRNPVRHYAGRAFATAASLTLHLPIYDTQCGAKLFRASPLLHRVLAMPFQSRWIFDVELLGRFLQAWRSAGLDPEEKVYELPLKRWVDVAGSKVKPSDFFRSFSDLLQVRGSLRRWSKLA